MTEDSKPEWTWFRHPKTIENSEIGLNKQREHHPRGKGGLILGRSQKKCKFIPQHVHLLCVCRSKNKLWTEALLITESVAGCPEASSLPPWIILGGCYVLNSLWSCTVFAQKSGCQHPIVSPPFTGRFSFSSKLTEMEVNIQQRFTENWLRTTALDAEDTTMAKKKVRCSVLKVAKGGRAEQLGRGRGLFHMRSGHSPGKLWNQPE